VDERPLLSIAIPTYNRVDFLSLCLRVLLPQVRGRTDVEVTVFDNASPDGTQALAERLRDEQGGFVYRRNAENIGSDRNIAQCFDEARGVYVWILGDDDVVLPGALDCILNVIHGAQFGVIFARAYGYDEDFMAERPFNFGSDYTIYEDGNAYIRKVGLMSSFISSIILNKPLLSGMNARQFAGTSIVQSYLFFHAALRGAPNVLFHRYLVAAKRDNSGGYSFSQVFGHNYAELMLRLAADGLTKRTMSAVNRKSIWLYFPGYVLRLQIRRKPLAELQHAYQDLRALYGGEWLFWVVLVPMFKLPRALSILWGCIAVAAGKLANGEFSRVLAYAANRAARAARRALR